MRVITALFDTYEDAALAIRALRDLGVRSEDISIIANNAEGYVVADEDEVAEDAGAGAGIGALLGGAGGLLAGLGAIAIPGLGPVLAGGWLLSTAVGAVAGAAVGGIAGGIVGALNEAGVPESDAHVYAEGVRRGGTLITARVTDARYTAAGDIMRRNGIDPQTRRREYEQEGWDEFDEDAPGHGPEDLRSSVPYRPGL
jgi:hypothetical protein